MKSEKIKKIEMATNKQKAGVWLLISVLVFISIISVPIFFNYISSPDSTIMSLIPFAVFFVSIASIVIIYKKRR